MKLNCPFILASGSPRRRLLLEKLGLEFEIHVSDVDESFDPEDPPEVIVQMLSQKKCNAVAPQFPNSLTLAADTIVVLDGKILGKPKDSNEAISTLNQLSDRKHTVFTGISFLHPASNRAIHAYESTEVTFAPMTTEEIDSYVASGSPMDKAGSYGIQDDQGALYISNIQGDYYNVVGLPLHRMYSVLKNNFDDLLII